MIVGNPNAGKRLATIAIAIVLMTMILIAVLIGLRKGITPIKNPPLHPSTTVLAELLIA
jgi:hypothetical protein